MKLAIYDFLREPAGHALGMAPLRDVGVALACACGFSDTWEPHEGMADVAKRWNGHLRKRAR